MVVSGDMANQNVIGLLTLEGSEYMLTLPDGTRQAVKVDFGELDGSDQALGPCGTCQGTRKSPVTPPGWVGGTCPFCGRD